MELAAAHMALAQRSTFKLVLNTHFEYRAAFGEYRAGSDINIQNKFADTIYYYRAGCREYHTGSEINIQNRAEYILFISRWMLRISHWLSDQHSK